MLQLSAKNFFFPAFLRNKWWHTVLCVIIIFTLSLLPQNKLPKPHFSFEDLMVHFLMYSSLAYCIGLSIYDKLKLEKSKINLSIVPLILGLMGLLIEILQKILPIHRFFSWEDAACNFLGACSFYFIALKIQNSEI